MYSNSWFRKELPLRSLLGLGGGVMGALAAGGGPSITSTGGVKIEDPDTERTYHVFNNDNAPPTSAAPFTVSAPQDIYYLVIGGGGGGGYNSGGGGGAGALRSNHPQMPAPLRGAAYSVAPGTTYNIKVNSGGPGPGEVGGQSELGASNPTPITSDGGGYGGNTENPGGGSPGNGSGGAGGNNFAHISTSGGSGGTYGYAGGGQIAPAPGTSGGAGGGGAGEAGYSTGNVPGPLAPKRGNGGDGRQFPSLPGPVISPGIPSPHQSAFETAVGPTGWFAGGGGGHVDFADGPNPTNGGNGGGGNGRNPQNASGMTAGVYGTGGGGGGGVPSGQVGGNGLVVLYYSWTPPLSASGGNINGVEPGNGYKYHVFTSPGNFVVTGASGAVEMLVVGGGGPAGETQANTNVGSVAGGGGGGVVHAPAWTIAAGTHPVTIGDPSPQPLTTAGQNSTFVDVNGPATITALGGGMGNYYNVNGGGGDGTGFPGGSGGGGGYPGAAGGSGTQPTQNPGVSGLNQYGNAGGTAYAPEGGNYMNGGGGGSGAVGQPGNGPGVPAPGTAGAGGAGQPFSGFAGPLLPTMPAGWKTATAPQGYYAGGGGAGVNDSTTTQPGGVGGGGRSTTAPESPTLGNGVTNTGGGAGGNENGPGPNGAVGGKGGSGVVIIRYLT